MKIGLAIVMHFSAHGQGVQFNDMPLVQYFLSPRVIVKSGVWHDESGGDLVDLCYLDSIFEFDFSYDLGEIIETT